MSRGLFTILTFLFLLPNVVKSQNYGPEHWKIWKTTFLSGDIHFSSTYQQRKVTFQSISGANQWDFNGGINFNAQNYILHPKFLKVNISAEFNPGTNNINYWAIPDQSLNFNRNKLDINSILFSTKPFTITSRIGFNQSFFNRDNLISTYSFTKYRGITANYNNKVLPFSFSYDDSKGKIEQINTQQRTKIDRKKTEFNVNKSFFSRDYHNFSYSFQKNQFSFHDLDIFYSDNKQLRYNAYINFDKKKRYYFTSDNSKIRFVRGLSRERILSRQNLNFQFPYNFNLKAGYQYSNLELTDNQVISNNFSTNLRHSLFESLQSQLGYIYNESDMGFRKNFRDDYLYQITYKKDILSTHFTFSYQNRTQNIRGISIEGPVNIYNEEITLSDGEITLISNPFVSLESIIVRDLEGLVLYRPGIDYLIFEQGDFTEIQRIPGGLIPNNSVVIIDYTYIQPPSYSYQQFSNTINTSLTFYKNIFNIYFHSTVQDFKNEERTYLLLLYPLRRTKAGLRVNARSISGKFEYQIEDSQIIPFKQTWINLSWNPQIEGKISYNVRAQASHYEFTNEDTERFFASMNGNLKYVLNQKNIFTITGSYQFQETQGFRLYSLSGGVQYSRRFRKVTILTGADLYKSEIFLQKTDFISLYFKISRNFERR